MQPHLSYLECLQAQNLLVEIVQELAPWTHRLVPASFFLSRRFSFSKEEGSGRKSLEKLIALRKKVELFTGKANNKKKTEKSPLPQQAEKVIDQVQKAIGRLASSGFIRDPKEDEIKEVLLKVQPKLDQIIEKAQEEVHKKDEPLKFSSLSALALFHSKPFLFQKQKKEKQFGEKRDPRDRDASDQKK